jgi:4-hydroxymandelate oxidase
MDQSPNVAAFPSSRKPPRRLLQFIAASPLLAHLGAPVATPADPQAWAPRDLDKLIDSAASALDVFDFEPVMKRNVPPAHFGYMATGVDDEVIHRPSGPRNG